MAQVWGVKREGRVEGYGAGVGGLQAGEEGRVQWHPLGHGVCRVLGRHCGTVWCRCGGRGAGMVRVSAGGDRRKAGNKVCRKDNKPDFQRK